MSEENNINEIDSEFDERNFRKQILELAKLATYEEFVFNRDQITWVWDSTVRNCLQNNKEIPDHPGYPNYPTDKEIVKTAKLFCDFIYNK